VGRRVHGFVSTGIPNIETYMVVPPKTIKRMTWMRTCSRC
jgi:hypothetical protein